MDNRTQRLINRLDSRTSASPPQMIVKHLQGFGLASVKISDVTSSFPKLDQGMIRKVFTKLQNIGVLTPTSPGVYSIDRAKLSRVNVK